MKKLLRILVVAGLTWLVSAALVGNNCFAGALSTDVVRITKEDLKDLIGNRDIVIIDVRSERDWKRSGRMITGAVHEEPGEERSWARKYAGDKTLILYCG